MKSEFVSLFRSAFDLSAFFNHEDQAAAAHAVVSLLQFKEGCVARFMIFM